MRLIEIFQSVVAPQGRRAEWRPEGFVEAWESFVDEVVSGYSGDLYEYENELSVRDDLERALVDQRVGEHADWAPLKDSLVEADQRLMELLAKGPAVRPGADWWRERLPPYAGDDFAEDAARLFGVEVRAE